MKAIVQTNERGQITIPKKIRVLMPHLDVLEISYKNGKLILEPLMLRDDFLEELAKREKEIGQGKTYTLDEVDEMMKRHYAKKKKKTRDKIHKKRN